MSHCLHDVTFNHFPSKRVLEPVLTYRNCLKETFSGPETLTLLHNYGPDSSTSNISLELSEREI